MGQQKPPPLSLVPLLAAGAGIILLSAYSVLYAVLSTLHAFSHLIFRKILIGRYYDCPCFLDKENETWKIKYTVQTHIASERQRWNSNLCVGTQSLEGIFKPQWWDTLLSIGRHFHFSMVVSENSSLVSGLPLYLRLVFGFAASVSGRVCTAHCLSPGIKIAKVIWGEQIPACNGTSDSAEKQTKAYFILYAFKHRNVSSYNHLQPCLLLSSKRCKLKHQVFIL